MATGNRSLLIVHGRDMKPASDTYLDLSLSALRAGLARDYPAALDAYDVMQKDLAWYGDLTREVLAECGKTYDEGLDVADRRNTLAALREITARKRFGIGYYDRLPGKSAVPEFVASLLSPAMGSVGLSSSLISSVAKDVGCYFDRKSTFSDQVRARLRDKLSEMLTRGDRVCLVSHGTGSIVAYDVLWQLSHDPDLACRFNDCKVEMWLTLGAPLGDRFVQNRLLGAREKNELRFPANVISWHNVSAEDDYTCHDNTLADDFKMMLQDHRVSAVHDYKIFNLAVRYGKSNPHSSIGYYIHPRVSKIIADWLQATDAVVAQEILDL